MNYYEKKLPFYLFFASNDNEIFFKNWFFVQNRLVQCIGLFVMAVKLFFDLALRTYTCAYQQYLNPTFIRVSIQDLWVNSCLPHCVH